MSLKTGLKGRRGEGEKENGVGEVVGSKKMKCLGLERWTWGEGLHELG